MKNILITGCTGNLGLNLTKRLVSLKYNVIGTARNEKIKIEEKNFKFVKSDVSSEEFLKTFENTKIDLIIHTAALIPNRMQDKSKEIDLLKQNLGSTFNVLTLMERKKIKNLIFPSSMAVYGFPEYLPVDEKHPLKPINTYGLTKKQSEEYINLFSTKNRLSTAIFRFPGLFSSKIKQGGLYNFITKALKNEEISINLESPTYWDILHVDDAVEVIIKYIEKGDFSEKIEIFNVDYGIPIEIEEIVKIIIKLTNSKSSIKKTGDEKSFEFYYNIEKIKHELKWKPPTLQQRLKEYIKEVRQES